MARTDKLKVKNWFDMWITKSSSVYLSGPQPKSGATEAPYDLSTSMVF